MIVAFKIIISVDTKARLRVLVAISRVMEVTVSDGAGTTFFVNSRVTRSKLGISMYM